MTYKDLEKARVDRALKEQNKAKTKGRRGRKKKAVVVEEATGPVAEAGPASEASQLAVVPTQSTDILMEVDREESQYPRAPVARMW